MTNQRVLILFSSSPHSVFPELTEVQEVYGPTLKSASETELGCAHHPPMGKEIQIPVPTPYLLSSQFQNKHNPFKDTDTPHFLQPGCLIHSVLVTVPGSGLCMKTQSSNS